jgi:hypothetical protein
VPYDGEREPRRKSFIRDGGQDDDSRVDHTGERCTNARAPRVNARGQTALYESAFG